MFAYLCMLRKLDKQKKTNGSNGQGVKVKSLRNRRKSIEEFIQERCIWAFTIPWRLIRNGLSSKVPVEKLKEGETGRRLRSANSHKNWTETDGVVNPKFDIFGWNCGKYVERRLRERSYSDCLQPSAKRVEVLPQFGDAFQTVLLRIFSKLMEL